MMIVITYTLFVLLSGLAAFVQFIASRRKQEPNVGNNPHFVHFQRRYLLPYYPALLADWLQGNDPATYTVVETDRLCRWTTAY